MLLTAFFDSCFLVFPLHLSNKIPSAKSNQVISSSVFMPSLQRAVRKMKLHFSEDLQVHGLQPHSGSCWAMSYVSTHNIPLLQVTSLKVPAEFLHSCHLHHKRNFLHFLLHPTSQSFPHSSSNDTDPHALVAEDSVLHPSLGMPFLCPSLLSSLLYPSSTCLLSLSKYRHVQDFLSFSWSPSPDTIGCVLCLKHVSWYFLL